MSHLRRQQQLNRQKQQQQSTSPVKISPKQQRDNYLRQLFNNPDFSDFQIQLTSNNSRLFVHKIILSQCEFFKVCMDSKMIEATECVITIEDNAELMTILIQSLYTGELNEIVQIVPLLLLADKYQMNAAFDTLTSVLVSSMNRNNVLECLDLNLEDERLQVIKVKARQILAQESSNILSGNSYVQYDITKWIAALQLLVNQQTVVLAYEAVHKWIDMDVDNRAQYSYTLISLVRQNSNRSPYESGYQYGY